MKTNWLKDLQSLTDSIPYGDVEVVVTRVNKRTTKVVATSRDTLRFLDNSEALQDLMQFLVGLVDAGHTGTVQFEVVLKDGQISLIAIKNSRETSYQK